MRMRMRGWVWRCVGDGGGRGLEGERGNWELGSGEVGGVVVGVGDWGR